jgi:hypothetical protein
MCTNIATTTPIVGSMKIATGWTTVNQASIGFDHATHAWVDHAVTLSFTRAAPDADRVAVELDLESSRALLARLQEVIAAAEAIG